MPGIDLSQIFGNVEPEPDYTLPQNESLKRYGEHMAAMPQRGDFKNSLFDKIAAGLTGAAEGMRGGAGEGSKAGREILDRQYVNALRDHGTQGQGLKSQAEIEQEGIEQLGRVMQMRNQGRERAEDRRVRLFDYADRAKDRESRSRDRAEDNARADTQFNRSEQGRAAERAETARTHRENERLEGERIKAYGYGGMGRKIGPQARIPVDQYDKARQLAIEQILMEDPSAQKFFDDAKDAKGNSTGYRTMAPEIAHDGGWFGRSGTRPLTPEEVTHRTNIMKRIEEAQKKVLGTMVDPYDRD